MSNFYQNISCSTQAVLVTGASGGLGSAVVRELCSNGFHVFAGDVKGCSDSDKCSYLELDVTSENSIKAAHEEVIKKCSALGIDGLYAIIHLAGIYVMDSLVEISEDDMHRMVNINLLGAYRVNRIFLPSLLKTRGRIMVISSELAPLRPLPFNGIYTMTKTALDSYSHSLAMELVLHGIKVITIRPGAFGTGMIDAANSSMERMMQKSELYPNNAGRYRKIMGSETKNAKPVSIFAYKVVKILLSKHPRYKYAIGNSFKLRLVSALPTSLQAWVFKRLLGGPR